MAGASETLSHPFPFRARILTRGLKLVLFYLVFFLNPDSSVGTECMKRKYYEITVSYFGGTTIHFNKTVKCEMYFQWTVADICCYDRYDRFEKNPYCCYSETYKLVLAVTFICVVLFIGTFSVFFCWVYNLPHHLLYLFTCGRFHLNNWLLKNKNGPYVDPSFYAGEPFWARGAEVQPYPLKPMPPKIFYPAPPPKLKYRWDASNCEIPLFIIASRQFTRNPYSARPQDRSHNTHSSSLANYIGGSESRRNSLFSINGHTGGTIGASGGATTTSTIETPQSQQIVRRETNSVPSGGVFRRGSSALLQNRGQSGSNKNRDKENSNFKVGLDEVEAKAELREALKVLEEGTSESGSQSHSGLSEASSFQHENSIELGMQPKGDEDIDLYKAVRPNTTGGNGNLDQYGNYVSFSTLQQQRGKPNTALLNQQLTNLRLPVYNMPGVHNVLTTVQNYHVVSSNLGNPMETILEDDSLEDDGADDCRNKTPMIEHESSRSTPTFNVNDKKLNIDNKEERGTQLPHPHPLRRRATSITPVETGRLLAAMDHVVVSTPTLRAVVPFNPSLPGSLSDNDSSIYDTDYVERLQSRRELRRNSVV